MAFRAALLLPVALAIDEVAQCASGDETCLVQANTKVTNRQTLGAKEGQKWLSGALAWGANALGSYYAANGADDTAEVINHATDTAGEFAGDIVDEFGNAVGRAQEEGAEFVGETIEHAKTFISSTGENFSTLLDKATFADVINGNIFNLIGNAAMETVDDLDTAVRATWDSAADAVIGTVHENYDANADFIAHLLAVLEADPPEEPDDYAAFLEELQVKIAAHIVRGAGCEARASIGGAGTGAVPGTDLKEAIAKEISQVMSLTVQAGSTLEPGQGVVQY